MLHNPTPHIIPAGETRELVLLNELNAQYHFIQEEGSTLRLHILCLSDATSSDEQWQASITVEQPHWGCPTASDGPSGTQGPQRASAPAALGPQPCPPGKTLKGDGHTPPWCSEAAPGALHTRPTEVSISYLQLHAVASFPQAVRSKKGPEPRPLGPLGASPQPHLCTCKLLIG